MNHLPCKASHRTLPLLRAAVSHYHTIHISTLTRSLNSVRSMTETNQNGVKEKEKKTYHKKATGDALETVLLHAQDDVLRLYGSCFCPFVQRVWISLEAKKVPYQYIEVDPYSKPKSLLDINPRGLVPALRHGDWGCYESTILMEYLEDLNMGNPLLPPNPKTRAESRLWSDHINRHLIPAFYRYLQEQDANKQVDYALELKVEIDKLVDAASPSGPFFLGSSISFVDIQLAPWALRLRRVLTPYRGWPTPDPESRWGTWLTALEQEDSVRATTSSDDLYLDSYERYAGELRYCVVSELVGLIR
jgi:glutathione S-transferase